MAIDIEAINKKKEKKEEKKMQLGLLKTIRIYVLPLISILIFLFITFFFNVSKTFEIFDGLDEVDALNEELNETRERQAALQNLRNNEAELNSDLNLINELTSTGETRVVQYQENLKTLSADEGLETLNIEVGELRRSLAVSSQEGLLLRELPAELESSAPYSDIVDFIGSLNTLRDFVIVTEMKLNYDASSDEVNLWNLSLVLTKYQFFEEDPDFLQNKYLNIPPQREISDEVNEYLDRKGG